MSYSTRFYISIALFLLSTLQHKTLLFAQNNWASHYFLNGEIAIVDAVRQTSDDGFVLTGSIEVPDSLDLWVLKLDSSGAIQWQKTYGGTADDYGFWIEETNDDGYVVTGQTFSFGAGSNDVWILKLDQAGNVQWQKSFGGIDTDFALSVKQTVDNGFIVAATTSTLPGPGYWDFWLIKLDSLGNLEWQQTYGGPTDEMVFSVDLTSDGGFIVSGMTDSFGAGFNDFWLLKLDPGGGIQWQKTYGGPDTNEGGVRETQETSDGGFIVAGITSTTKDQSGDLFVLRLDSTGQIQWQKVYGSNASEFAASIQQTTDGGFIVGGQTEPTGAGTFWLLKLDAAGDVVWKKAYQGNDSELLTLMDQALDGGFVLASSDFNRIDSGGAWILKVDDNGEIDPSCTFITDTNTTPVNGSLVELPSSASVVDTSFITSSTTVIATPWPSNFHAAMHKHVFVL